MKSKLLILLIFFISCFCISHQQIRSKPIQTSKVILITIDGVRWQDMFDSDDGAGGFQTPDSRGMMPNIYHHFVDNGMAIGKLSPALVGGPAHVSMPGYLEIIRGYPTLDCFDNDCPENGAPTIFNKFANNSAVFSGWDTIAKTFDTSLAVVNIGKDTRSQQWLDLKLNENKSYPDEFGDEHYRPDTYTAEAALEFAYLPQPDFMWISFGDTDEWAHQNNKLMYLANLSAIDDFIGKLIQLADNNTVFILCPDHGRSADFMNHHWDPPSRRVWILMGGGKVPKVGFVKYNSDVYLSNIVPTILDITKNTYSPYSLLNIQ